jgi:putative ABC transport system permease protein
VNESFARRVAREDNPIGKRVFRGTIVGVVSDLRVSKLDADPEPEVYVPYRNAPYLRDFDVVIRTVGNPAAVATDLRKLISNIDPAQPVYDMRTLDRTLADSIAPRRLNMLLLGIFAVVALILASVGIYGVIAYAVTQRTQEIGVRMALGAREGEVVRMVVRQGMLVATAGVVVGLAAAVALTRLMGGLLYEVKPTDPETLAVVCAALAGAALLACWIPARRAAQVDPVVALRYE